jgi:hypothetical protein
MDIYTAGRVLCFDKGNNMPFFSTLRQEGDGSFYALWKKRETFLFYISSERTESENS